MFTVAPKFKIQYFDRNVIRTRWPKFNKDPIKHAGNLVMKIARGLIKRGKPGGKPRPPGQPPKSRKPGSTPPFKMIFSVPFRLGTAVIVGMVGFGGFGGGDLPPPGLQEHGGHAQRKVFIDHGRRRLKSGRYGKNRIQYKSKRVKYPRRPFMLPALMRARQVLPKMWQMSISVGGGGIVISR